MHANAAGVTPEGQFYINYRNISTFVVYDSNYPHEIIYSISPYDQASDYSFINEDDKFYSSHDPN